MTGPYSIDVVTTRREFECLSDAWDDLLRLNGEESPFLTHAWHQCCIEAEPSRHLRLLVARSGSSVVGIAPLWAGPIAYRGIPARGLTFISSSETAQSDFIVHPKARDAALHAFLRYFLSGEEVSWDIVSLLQWPTDSSNLQIVKRLLAEMRIPNFTGVSSVIPYLSITSDWEAYWSSRSYQFRKSRRGILNRLGRAGDAQVVLLEGNQAEEAFELYRTVSERGWKRAKGLSLSHRPATERFLRCLSSTAGKRRWLMVWVLRLQGTPVAAEYDLACGGRVYALRADFDEAYASHSPGAYLEYHIMRHLFEHCYREYNAGPGRDAYKSRWSETERVNRSVAICRPTARGMYAWLLEGRVAPWARRVRGALTGTSSGAP